MKDFQFLIIVGLMVSILREHQEGILGNVFGMCAGLIMGIGVYLWLTDKSKSE